MSNNDKKEHLLCPLLVHCYSKKPDIALNLSLANVLITACLLRYPLFSFKCKYAYLSFSLNEQCLLKLFMSIIMS